jgi:hypothetical protein
MPGRRISELTALSGAGSASNDDIVIFDADADETKRISRSQLAEGMQTDVQVFSNKTLNLGLNTLTGTTAQFNTALSDNDFATQAGTETLTNKTVSQATNTMLAADGTRVVDFENVAAVKAWNPATAPADGTIISTRAEKFSYEVDSGLAATQVVGSSVKLAARPFDGPFYARSMHTFDVSGVTDERANLQGAIDFARANGKRHMVLPAGTLLIDGTIVVGNTGAGFHTLWIEGATGSFLGTTRLVHAPGQVLNPLINVVGTRMFRLTDLRLSGNNAAPASRNGENFRDSVYANWITPGVSAGRYNPYAGVAFSALQGSDPGAGNNYTFGSYGQAGLASKAFFERIRVEGFVAGAVLAPNAGTPGIEDILFRDSSILENTYGICTTGTQQRNVIVDNCNLQGSWALFDNVTFGSKEGQPIYVRNSNLGKSVNSVQSAVAVGSGTVRDCYFENVRSIGVVGNSGSSARFTETFDGCNMSLIGHDDDGTEEQKDIPIRNFKSLEIINGAILCKNVLLAAPEMPVRLKNVGIRCETTAEQATWGFFAPQGSEWRLSLEGCEMRAYSGPTRYINDVEEVNTVAARALIGPNTREIIRRSDGRRLRIVRHPVSYRGPVISALSYDSKDELSFDFTTAVDRPIAVNDLVMWRVFVPGVNDARATTAILPALRITGISGTRVTCKVIAHIDTTYSPSSVDVVVQNFVNATEATGDTTSGSASITNVTNIGNFQVGDWITFNNPSYPTQVRITGISGTTVTCHRTLNVTATAEPIFNARLVLI